MHVSLRRRWQARSFQKESTRFVQPGRRADALAAVDAAREDAAAKASVSRCSRPEYIRCSRATHETMLQDANAARTKAEASLSLPRDTAAQGRRLREAVARAEALHLNFSFTAVIR